MSWRDHLRGDEAQAVETWAQLRDEARKNVALFSAEIRQIRNTCIQRAKRVEANCDTEEIPL